MLTQAELRQQITQQIIETLKSDSALPPWRRPWRLSGAEGGFPVNVVSGRRYRGLNVCLLDMAASRYGFRSRSGKSQLAKVVAAELACPCHEVLGQAIQTPADLSAVLLAAREKDLVFLDEAHELPKEQQTALYLAVDQRKIVLSGGKSGGSPQSIPLANFTLFLATTDEYDLLQPLRDRMKLTLRFPFYSEDELATLTVQRSCALEWDVVETVFPEIAKRAKGTPRLALRLLQAARRVCRAEGDTTITLQHLQRACALEGIAF